MAGAAEFVRGVFQHHREVLEVEGIAQRRLHAHVGGDAGEHQVADAARAQRAVERAVEEAAVARLGHDDVAGLRLHLFDELVVPAALGEELALQLGLGAHGLQCVRLVPVGRAGAAGFHVRRVPAVLQEHDQHAGRARRRNGAHDVRDGALRAGDVEAGRVDVAAERGVGVLHVDHDQRRVGGVQRERLGPCGQHERGGRAGQARCADGRGRGEGGVACGCVHVSLLGCILQAARRSGSTCEGTGLCTCARLFMSGWMRSPKASTPCTKSSKVSSTPSVPGTSATSSSMRATLA
jgi:hypothetical protein